MTKIKPGTINLVWQLYTDLKIRCNQLIDECGHLQSTIISQIDLVRSDDGAGNEKGVAQPEKERPWIPELGMIRDETYYSTPPQDRALRNLYIHVGAIAESLEVVSKEVERSYFAVLGEQTRNKQDTDALFWFLCLRGHIYGKHFPYILKHLQHAQEKVIQLLENMPGLLPGPTLMRRWSSGGYGELLSEYSRQVNQRVQQLVFDICTDSAEEGFDEWRKSQFLTHAWSHHSTSLTTLNTLGPRQSQKAEEARSEQISMMTIWSSYFYLEQPILFPLLYHECAHHYSDPKKVAIEGSVDSILRRLLLDRPQAVADALKAAYNFDQADQGFWREFTSEVWADSISIALSGEGFLAPLLLQIAGLQGETFPTYSDYEPDTDTRISLDDSGSPSRRTLHVPYPILSLSYFWEARAILASRVYQEIYGVANDSWAGAIEDLVAAWRDSGRAAMNDRVASAEHQTYWEYRVRLNDWVADIVWDGLAEFCQKLRLHLKIGATEIACIDAPIPPAVCELVAEDAREYLQSRFDGCNSGTTLASPYSAQDKWRQEEIASRIRWWAGVAVTGEFARAGSRPPAAGFSQLFDRWAKVYCNHLACDGSVGFRIAHEWQAVRAHFFSTGALVIKSWYDSTLIPRDLTQAEKDLLKSIDEAVAHDLRAKGVVRDDASSKGDAIKWALRLEKRGMGYEAVHWPQLRELFEKFDAKVLTPTLQRWRLTPNRVGSFTLGAIKPTYFSKNGIDRAVIEMEGYCGQQRDVREGRLFEAGFSRSPVDFRHDFLALLGEYSFGVYQPGFSCLNKSIHLTNQPPSILKQRDVLKISSRSKGSTCINGFCRVSQISFRYRWQWVLLCDGLSQSADVYLSSAWEDIILVTDHETLGAYDRFIEDNKLAMRGWMDVHSNVGPSKAFESGVTRLPAPSGPTLEDFGRRISAYLSRPVSVRTGRYDISIDWGSSQPNQVWNSLAAIPKEEWQFVESITTALYSTIRGPRTGSNSTGAVGTGGPTLISQIILRHRGQG